STPTAPTTRPNPSDDTRPAGTVGRPGGGVHGTRGQSATRAPATPSAPAARKATPNAAAANRGSASPVAASTASRTNAAPATLIRRKITTRNALAGLLIGAAP